MGYLATNINMKITNVHARQILDSRGLPTVEVDVVLENEILARAAVPSGVSAGSHEAVELRDGDLNLYNGKSVLKAVGNINGEIAEKLTGADSLEQRKIDQIMIDLDGTEKKSRLGANSILAVSMAVCRAAAISQKTELFSYIGGLAGQSDFQMPRPMILMLEGGKHGNFATDIQEFMIIPKANFGKFSSVLEAATIIFHTLEKKLKSKNYSTGLGLEGGFCPKEIGSNEEAFEILVEAISSSGFTAGTDFQIAVDLASSEFFENETADLLPGSGEYILKSEGGKKYLPKEWTEKIIAWTKKYPIYSLEDPHQEDLWNDWSDLTEKLHDFHQIVGDDLVTTNSQRIKQAIKQCAINAVLIKLNQIGTVSETLEAIKLTHQAKMTSIVSHRAGETNDDFIADFCIGTGSEQCKFGGVSRGERIAKYNQLLRIEEVLI